MYIITCFLLHFSAGSGVLAPCSSAPLLAPTSLASHVGLTQPSASHSMPKLTPFTPPTLVTGRTGNPPAAPQERGDGERGGGKERREEKVTTTTQDEEVSLSSIPLSLPGENR